MHLRTRCGTTAGGPTHLCSGQPFCFRLPLGTVPRRHQKATSYHCRDRKNHDDFRMYEMTGVRCVLEIQYSLKVCKRIDPNEPPSIIRVRLSSHSSGLTSVTSSLNVRLAVSRVILGCPVQLTLGTPDICRSPEDSRVREVESRVS